MTLRSILVRDTVTESLWDFLLKSQTPVDALWSLRSIDLTVMALHPFFFNLRMPQNASLIPLISEPIRVNVFSFVTRKRGNSQYPKQILRRLQSASTGVWLLWRRSERLSLIASRTSSIGKVTQPISRLLYIYHIIYDMRSHEKNVPS